MIGRRFGIARSLLSPAPQFYQLAVTLTSPADSGANAAKSSSDRSMIGPEQAHQSSTTRRTQRPAWQTERRLPRHPAPSAARNAGPAAAWPRPGPVPYHDAVPERRWPPTPASEAGGRVAAGRGLAAVRVTFEVAAAPAEAGEDAAAEEGGTPDWLSPPGTGFEPVASVLRRRSAH